VRNRRGLTADYQATALGEDNMGKKGTTKKRAIKIKDSALIDADDVKGGGLLVDGVPTVSPLPGVQIVSPLQTEAATLSTISNRLKMNQDVTGATISNMR
jgi:hypothetical protein